MQNGYNNIIERIDAFIRKYYQSLIFKGIFLFLLAWLVIYLAGISIEYFAWLPVKTRTIVFYSGLFIYLFLFSRYILLPLLWFLGIGKSLSRKQAAGMLSEHFPEMKDKLLNILELKELESNNGISEELILASIDQKTEELRNYSFNRAIDFRPMKKYARYFIISLVLFALLFIIKPSLITEGTERIIHYKTFYEKPAPFHFTLLNKSLISERGKDITIQLQVDGEYIPEMVYIHYGGNNFLMNKEKTTQFSYTFKHLNNSLPFFFQAENIPSETYNIEVFPTPSILDFQVKITVPSYTFEDNRVLKNIGDFSLPAGSMVEWTIETSNINSLIFTLGKDTLGGNLDEQGIFSIKKRLLENSAYAISAKNDYIEKNNLLKYFIHVVPDLYPQIDVVPASDSLKPFLTFYRGSISDDYGFSTLYFHLLNENDKDSLIEIPIDKNLQDQEFYYAFDFSSLNTSELSEVEYYFEVWDNDRVNGFKATKSSAYVFSLPSKADIDSLENKAGEKMQKLLDESKRLSDELKKDVKKLREKNLEENLSSWEQSQMIENVLDKQQSLEEMLKELQEQNQLKNELENTLGQKEDELLEKQEQIQELLDELLDDEMKKLLEELQKLQENFNQEKLDELSKDMEMSYDDLNEQLEKNLELLKHYEVEKELNETIDELNELSEKQDQLGKETLDKKSDTEELAKKEAQQKKDFDQLNKKYQDLQKKNSELSKPMPMDDMNQEFNQGNENFNQDQQNLQQNKRKKAGSGMKKNSQHLKKMSNSLQMMMQSGMMNQQSENLKDLEQIIENLISFSFEQEDLLLKTKNTEKDNPLVIQLMANQQKINRDFEIIRDSLNALGARVPQLGKYINKELLNIRKRNTKIEDLYQNLHLFKVASEQQFVMTSANNLALLLSEAKEQMQQEMSMQMAGQQQCQKPGQGMPMMQSMQQMQKSMKDQLKGMIEQMKNGGKNGQKMDQDALNKRLAQMMAQQEIFKQMMKKYGQKNGISPQTQKILNEINKLVDENKKQIVKKNVTPELLKRQELILTRLLEAEKSDNEREIEKKRKSTENKKELISNPEKYFEYKERKNNFNELFEYQNLKLSNYFKNKYRNYLQKLNKSE